MPPNARIQTVTLVNKPKLGHQNPESNVISFSTIGLKSAHKQADDFPHLQKFMKGPRRGLLRDEPVDRSGT